MTEPTKMAETLRLIERLAREACVTNSRDVMDWHDDMNYIAVVAKRAIDGDSEHPSEDSSQETTP